jgi:hypothetical protein
MSQVIELSPEVSVAELLDSPTTHPQQDQGDQRETAPSEPSDDERSSKTDWHRRLNVAWRVMQIIVTFYLITSMQVPMLLHWMEVPWAPIVEKSLPTHRT